MILTDRDIRAMLSECGTAIGSWAQKPEETDKALLINTIKRMRVLAEQLRDRNNQSVSVSVF